MSENEINSAPIQREKRKYSPRKPKVHPISEQFVPPPAPLPPNPNVIAMESRISELVEQRSAAQYAISRANQQFVAAQGGLQAAKDEFNRIEGEIQFRMTLINQMRGGSPAGFPPPPQYSPQPAPYTVTEYPMSPAYQPAQPYPIYPAPFDPRQVPAFGVGSAPAPNRGLYPDLVGGPNGELTGNAEETRLQELRSRGY